MLVYKFVTDRLKNTMEGNYCHPFALKEHSKYRYSLRKNLQVLLSMEQYEGINSTNMFEACPVQPTTALGFHNDAMNSPSIKYCELFPVFGQ
jgi:hypothetical protein